MGDKSCSSQQSLVPSALGCFCTSETSSYRASCSNDSVGEVIEYSDSICGEVKEVKDHSQCLKEKSYDWGLFNAHMYRQIEYCIINPIINDSTSFWEWDLAVPAGAMDVEQTTRWVIVGLSVGAACVLCTCIT